MNKKTLHIKGMHCRSCEILIEDELLKTKGVTSAVVNHKLGTAEIYYNHEPDFKVIEDTLIKSGYSLGKDHLSFFSKNPNDYLELGIVFMILIIGLFIANDLGIFNLSFKSSGDYSSLPVVLLIGLTAGFSTCMALVGGLVLGASARFAEKHPTATSIQKFKPHIFFNLGRIISFFVLGGVIGYAGSFFQLSPFVLGLLTIAVGGVMLLLGLQLIDISPRLSKFGFTLPKGLSRFFGVKEHSQKEYSHKNSAILGALTFFLPCGFTQAMQLFAISSGNPLTGAMTMGVFAIGTAPGLLGIGGLTSVIKGIFSRYFFKFAGLVVILLSVFNLSNGYNLSGLNLSILPGLNTSASSGFSDQNVTVKDGVQIVNMTQESSGYSPNTFTIKKDVPVKWIITSVDPNSCASSIVSAKLGIKQSLQEGENIIEFTPVEAGTVKFSCIMGMYGGVFNVVDENDKQPSSQTVANQAASCGGGSSQGQSGCSAGGGGCGCGGGARQRTQQQANVTPQPAEDVGNKQLIKATYTYGNDIQPSQFAVKTGTPVRFEIDAKDDGSGCMGSVTIPGLTRDIQVFTKGETNVFEFTPTKVGKYEITCGMGIPRGEITVN